MVKNMVGVRGAYPRDEQNVTGGAGASGGLTPEEAFHVKRWQRAFGVTEKSASMVAAREAWARDPEGGTVVVDLFEVLTLRARAAASTPNGQGRGAPALPEFVLHDGGRLSTVLGSR